MANISLVGPNIDGAIAWLRLMDRLQKKIRAAVFVASDDESNWRLLVVSNLPHIDDYGFYHEMAAAMSTFRSELQGFEVSDLELVSADNKIIRGLKKQVGRFRDKEPMKLTFQPLGDVYLPIAFLLRLDL